MSSALITEPERTDFVRRFTVEGQGLRGQFVRLGPAWLALREHADYPPMVRDTLGEAVAATVLLASTLKFAGELTVQIQSDGPLRLLVAQCTHDFRIRAVARFDRERLATLRTDSAADAAISLAALVGAGQLLVTVDTQSSAARYQGIVPLDGTSLAACLVHYFATSEQLSTSVALAADSKSAAGVLIQRIPDEGGISLANEAQTIYAQGAAALAELSPDELLLRPAHELMQRAFHGHDLRLYDQHAVAFQCRCSEPRVVGMLRSLGATELHAILAEQGSVTVTCEFCHKPWMFDAIDVSRWFDTPEDRPPGSASVN